MHSIPVGKLFTLEVTIQARAADSEQLRCADAIAMAVFEHARNMVFADFSQRKRLPGITGLCAARWAAQMLRQVAHIDKVAG